MNDALRFYDRALARMSRRELLNTAWALGAAAVIQPIVSARVIAQPLFRAYPFPLGVASGDPWPDSVVLWTRLAPDPLDGGGMPMVNVDVTWEIASDPALRTIVAKGSTIARPELGHSVHVEANGLQPGREYFYRFRCGNEVSPIGRTRTAPLEGAAVDRLRFAICGCSHYEAGYFTAYRHLAEESFDFVFHSGDYIYEDRADGGRNARIRQHNGDEIFTVVDYRNRYALYKLDADLRAAHQATPFILTWDDHEVDNDHAGDRDGVPGGCPDARDPARTILGAEQEKWLFDNLATSRGTWTVIAQQVPSFVRDAKTNPTGTAMDKWDGYAAARQRLYGRLRDAKTANPIVLSGDVHTHWGADLKMDFGNPKSETVAVEFTNSSITSGGDGRDTMPNWERIQPDNPQILYHSARRGYVACTATPATMRADFRTIDRVSTPGGSVSTGGSVVVEAGRPGGSRA